MDAIHHHELAGPPTIPSARAAARSSSQIRTAICIRRPTRHEKIGPMPKAARRDSGNRDYDERARDLGFPIEEIGKLLAIATGGSAAYLRRVSLTRLIRFLTILALALSPLATFVGTPASAAAHHSAMAAEGHQMAGHEMPGHDKAGDVSMAAMPLCKDMGDKPTDQPCGSGDGDCVKACAAVPAIPAVGGQLEPHALPHGPQLLPALVSVPHGLVPEAATPPPRGFLKI